MKAMNLGLMVFLVQAITFNAQAQQSADKYKVPEPYEAGEGQLFDETEYTAGTSVLSQFDNVIVVNKAAKGTTAQTLKLYSKGYLVLTTEVSTGKEDVEIVKGAKKLFRKLFGGRGTTTSHWRHTSRGAYTVKRIENGDYRSGESKFQMPYAMFFDDKHGIAVHQVPPDLSGGEAAGESQLGSRASSGCVRVHKNTIQDIHRVVSEAGRGMIPVIDSKTGLQVINKDGSLATTEGFRTIVIVQEVND